MTKSKINLSNRLLSISSFIKEGSCVADVGSDHGFLPIFLLTQGISKKVYAIENKIGPFTRLKQNVNDSGLEKAIPCLMSDGIKDLPNDVDTLVIAGMGTESIKNILFSHIEKLKNVKNIIVDSHTDLYNLRSSIVSLNYTISEEKMIFEKNIYYTIINFSNFKSAYSEEDYEFGPILRKDKPEIYQKYWKSRLDKLNKIKKANLSIDRVRKLESEVERIKSNL